MNIWDLAKIVFVIALVLQGVPVLVWLERKISASIQGRIGPNRTAVLGLKAAGFFQPVADAVKLLFKEDVTPGAADRFLYQLAPLFVFVPPLLVFTVIPFGNRIGEEHLQVANLPIGVLFVMSVLSLGVYGVAFGGWASNNKYSLLGGLRASAQLISYELTLGLSIITIILMAGTVDMREIVARQTRSAFLSWNLFGGGNLLLLPSGLVAGLVFYVAALAENNRLPFDLPECEAELVAGYHTEYSSMKFAMYFMAEYAAMITMSALFVTLFLGGWHFPGLVDPADTSWIGGLLSHGVFVAKMGAVIALYIWIRWTLPRFRYDQLMRLGWKVLLPIALVNLLVIAVIGVAWGER
ncbi:MAG: NADH-quinone oxidoreductase subunit NuoH [Planctomycetes bacterium]|nr:NADH-quinone oxidoreductase subunit NuoH [Planctomycetota bacterium]